MFYGNADGDVVPCSDANLIRFRRIIAQRPVGPASAPQVALPADVMDAVIFLHIGSEVHHQKGLAAGRAQIVRSVAAGEG